MYEAHIWIVSVLYKHNSIYLRKVSQKICFERDLCSGKRVEY